MKLNHCANIQLIPTSPFNFDSTFFKPDHFTTNDHAWVPGTRWQTINWRKERLGLKFEDCGSVNKPLIDLTIYSSDVLNQTFIKSLTEELSYRYNLNLDLSDFYEKYGSHPVLKKAIKNLYGMRPGHPSSLYEYLIIGIVLQNASVKRSIQMFENLLKNYGEYLEFDGRKLGCLWQVGKFREVDERELRELKVGYRAKSIKRIDEQFSNNLIDEFKLRKAEVDTQKKSLLSLYGVGPATTWYLLFDIFHRWEVFEHISPWEQKIYSQMFFKRGLDDVATKEELFALINEFGDYKHLAVHYLWEDLWWRREKGEKIEWLEKEIRR